MIKGYKEERERERVRLKLRLSFNREVPIWRGGSQRGCQGGEGAERAEGTRRYIHAPLTGGAINCTA